MTGRDHLSPATPQNQSGRRARLSRNKDDSPIGVALFVTAEELVMIGIDTATTEFVELRIANSELRISPVSPEDRQ